MPRLILCIPLIVILTLISCERPDTNSETQKITKEIETIPITNTSIDPELESTFAIETIRGEELTYKEIDKIWHMRNYPKQISWMHEGEKILITDDGGYILTELWGDFVIVLYEANGSTAFPHPNNLVIYNKDGSRAASVAAPSFKTAELLEKTSPGAIGHMESLTKSDTGQIEITVSDRRTSFIEIQVLDFSSFSFLEEAKYGGRW